MIAARARRARPPFGSAEAREIRRAGAGGQGKRGHVSGSLTGRGPSPGARGTVARDAA